MARCACGTATCSCIVKAVPGSGIVVVGNGSPTRPYQIGQEGGGNPLLNLDVIDSPSLDLTISGAGTLVDKRIVTGVAHPSMRELRDVDAADVPANGDVVTWSSSLSKWVFSAPAAGSGVPPGGTTGQVLTKYSNLDGQANWQTPASGSGTVLPPVIAAFTRAAALGPIITETQVIFDTTEKAADGITYDIATGNFTVVTTGWYLVTSRLRLVSATAAPGVATQFRLVINGAIYDFVARNIDTTASSMQIARQVYLTAGDVFGIRLSSAGAGVSLSTSASRANNVEVSRIAGGGIASERLYASVRKQAAVVAVAHQTATLIPWDTVETDDGIAFAAGVWTIPVTGYYQILAAAQAAGTNTTGYRQVRIVINGSTINAAFTAAPSSATDGGNVPFTKTLKLSAGDQVELRAYHSAGGGVTVNFGGSATNNWVSITKVPETIPASSGIIGERIYAAVRRTSVATSVATGATGQVIPFEIDERNDGIGWDATNNWFIVPVTGWYVIEGSLHWAANTTAYRTTKFYINGIATEYFQNNAGGSSGGTSSWGTFRRYLNAGDTVALWGSQGSGAGLALAGGATYNYFGIEKVPSVFPQSVALGERTYAIARRHATATPFANNTILTVPFDTTTYDDAAGGITYNAGTGEFTIPVAGYYQIDTCITWASNATGARIGYIYVNGVRIHAFNGAPGASSGNSVVGAQTIKCAAGDAVTVRTSQISGGSLNLGGSADYTWVTITKVPAPAVAGSAASGVWGVGALANYGSDTLQGRPVYVDANGQLRAEPAGVWVDCAAEVRFCTDVSTTANAGQVITNARYMRIGKTVWFKGYGTIGSGAVVNFALLLPPSAGVPVTSYTQVGPPQATTGGGEAVLGGWFLASGDRIVNVIGSSGTYSDSVANQSYRWSIVYEVV